MYALVKVCRENPHNSLYHLVLTDYALKAGQLGDAIVAAVQAVENAPADPRATFALGTVLRTIAYSGKDKHIDAAATLAAKGVGRVAAIVNLSPDEAAQEAIRAFERTLQLGVRRDEEPAVRRSLQVMRQQFGVND